MSKYEIVPWENDREVHHLYPDYECCRQLCFIDQDTVLQIMSKEPPWSIFVGKRLVSLPRIEVKFDPSESSKPPGDFFFCAGSPDFPVFSERAVERIGDILSRFGQLFELASADGRFFAYNVTNVVDCLDRERSDIKMFKGRILNIYKFEFRLERPEEVCIFKIPERIGQYSFVTRRFCELWKRHDLKGLFFKIPDEGRRI